MTAITILKQLVLVLAQPKSAGTATSHTLLLPSWPLVSRFYRCHCQPFTWQTPLQRDFLFLALFQCRSDANKRPETLFCAMTKRDIVKQIIKKIAQIYNVVMFVITTGIKSSSWHFVAFMLWLINLFFYTKEERVSASLVQGKTTGQIAMTVYLLNITSPRGIVFCCFT